MQRFGFYFPAPTPGAKFPDFHFLLIRRLVFGLIIGSVILSPRNGPLAPAPSSLLHTRNGSQRTLSPPLPPGRGSPNSAPTPPELPGEQKSKESNEWSGKQSFIGKSMWEAAPGLGILIERKDEQCGKGGAMGTSPLGLHAYSQVRIHLGGERRMGDMIRQVKKLRNHGGRVESSRHPSQDPSYSL